MKHNSSYVVFYVALIPGLCSETNFFTPKHVLALPVNKGQHVRPRQCWLCGLARRNRLLFIGSKSLSAPFTFMVGICYTSAPVAEVLLSSWPKGCLFLNVLRTSCLMLTWAWNSEPWFLSVWSREPAPGAVHSPTPQCLSPVYAGTCGLHRCFPSFCVSLGIKDSILRSDNLVILSPFRAEKV